VVDAQFAMPADDRAVPPGAIDAARVRRPARSLAFVLIVGAVFIAGAFLQIKGVNGAWYWTWPWRRLKPLHTALWLALPMIPFVFAVRSIERRATIVRPVAGIVLLLMLAAFALQVCATLSLPQGIGHLQAIVESPRATSYYGDALGIASVSDWLANFHTARLGLHAATHPPGPTLYYTAWIALLGHPNAAPAGALMLGAIATLGIPLLYAFIGLWSDDRHARLVACAFYALVPAFVVFLPEFDQVYPVFALAIVIAWVRSLRGEPWFGVLAGAAFALATFFAFNLLVIGAFLALYAAYRLRLAAGHVAEWRRLLLSTALLCGTYVAIYGALWFATGYDLPHSFAHALSIQKTFMDATLRPWRATVVFDWYDFLLGSGILAAPLLLLFLRRAAAEFAWRREDLVIPLIGLATIMIVDVSGLLPGENARVWMFMQPFVIAPAALETQRFDARGRALIFAAQWLVVLTMFCKMTFIVP
jgi:hypothetical protein